MIKLKDYCEEHRIKFGTSGIRALNSSLTDKVCYIFTIAFLQYLEKSSQLGSNQQIILAGDLRENTSHIISIIYQAIIDKGHNPVYCGNIPTPALCFYALNQQCPGIMVTGSHIPGDMNGLKFYKANGEILKEDEQLILMQTISIDEDMFDYNDRLKSIILNVIPINTSAYEMYMQRYLDFIPVNGLKGLNIGVYCHSSVAIKILISCLENMGANVTAFGESQTFIGIDTENLTNHDVNIAQENLTRHKLDVIVSTDADGDRPLISDELGSWIHGDIIGILCAIILKANNVVVPLSCNSSIDEIMLFKNVYKTKIGSPYIIEKINSLIELGESKIIGFESNGGVIIATDFTTHGKSLSALPSRDSILPILCILNYINKNNLSLLALINTYCDAYTVSSSIKNISPDITKELFTFLNQNNNLLRNAAMFFSSTHAIKAVDQSDGLRFTFINDNVIYLRQSGNAPELRCYTEAKNRMLAEKLNLHCINIIKQWIGEYHGTIQ